MNGESIRMEGPRCLTTKSGNLLCFIPREGLIYMKPDTGAYLTAKSELKLGKPIIPQVEWGALMQNARETLREMTAVEIDRARKAMAKRKQMLQLPTEKQREDWKIKNCPTEEKQEKKPYFVK